MAASERVLGVGVIGLGGASLAMIPKFVRNPNFRIAAAADIDAEIMDRFRKDFPDAESYEAAAAVRAVFDVDVEDPFEQPGPTQARRRSLTLGVIVRGLGGTLWRSGNDFTAQLGVGRQNSMEADQMQTRPVTTLFPLSPHPSRLSVRLCPPAPAHSMEPSGRSAWRPSD